MASFIKSSKRPVTSSHEICEKCNCVCNVIHFQQNFKNWTSGNNDIDKFIQDSQLSAHDNPDKVLEWIPYDRFYDIKYINNITKGSFGKVYRTNWIDGSIFYWSDYNQNWKRNNQNMFVILKSLNNPNDITSEFINEVL